MVLIEQSSTVLWELTYLPTGTKYNEAVNEVHACVRAREKERESERERARARAREEEREL